MDVNVTHASGCCRSLGPREHAIHVLLTKRFILKVIGVRHITGLDFSEAAILLSVLLGTAEKHKWLVISVDGDARCL